MSGNVLEIGIVQFSLATGAEFEPGLSATNMSFRPVFGRSSADASVWTSFLYFGSMSKVMIALPSLSCVLAMSPMRTPDTRMVWP